MFINHELCELNLKLVYYGPSFGGKTTNLRYIHAHTRQSMRSQLISLKSNQGNTLFFDFMQLEIGKVGSLRPKFKLFSMAGQVCYAASRRLLLRGTDCIVFVVDSDRNRLVDNFESWHTMERHLIELGHNVTTFPIVIQLNKRDVSCAASKDILCHTFGIKGRPCFEAVASEGVGVLETFKAGLQAAIASTRCTRCAA
jgi:mutual gliding-motility protein MglA